MSKLDLSIIVLNYNTKITTINCLKSLVPFLGSNIECLVLDNGSSDGFYNDAKKLFAKTKNLSFFRSTKNLGFGGGNNLAVQKSKGKYLLFLNSDTIIQENIFVQTLDHLKSHPDTIAVSCSLRNPDGTLQINGGYFPTVPRVFFWQTFMDDLPIISSMIKSIHPHGENFNFVSKFLKGFSLYSDKPSLAVSLQERDWLTGAYLMISKPDFLKAGGFDPGIFMYAEEMELCFRLKKSGRKLMVLGDLFIIHLGGVSSGSTLAISGEVKGMIHFFNKHYPSSLGIIKMTFFIGSLLRLLIFGIIKNNAKARDAYKQILLDLT